MFIAQRYEVADIRGKFQGTTRAYEHADVRLRSCKKSIEVNVQQRQ